MVKCEIKDAVEENIEDQCYVCTASEKREDHDWTKGMEEKKKWAIDLLRRWGSFTKIAYYDEKPAGMVQYRAVPVEKIVSIDCIYVPQKEHWHKGIPTKFVSDLTTDVKKPFGWFGNTPPSALVVLTFPDESEGQFPARLLFLKKDLSR